MSSSKLCSLLVAALCVANAVPAHKLYPYGSDNGDYEMPRNLHEVTSGENTLTVPIKFYGEGYPSIYVNANGLLSFLTPLPTFINTQFPLDYPVIAALYANTDIRTSGHVYYREDRTASSLDRATNDVRQAFPNHHFVATSVFVATWAKVGYFDRKSDKVNTFQVAIASNGTDSYVEFVYPEDGIQWLQGEGQPGTDLPDAKAQAGFVAYNGRTYLLQGSGTDQIRNLMRLSNANEEGLWIFRVGDVGLQGNVEVPDKRHVLSEQVHYPERESNCASGFATCHSQATCVDTPKKYCCVCRKGFYGNGFNCLKEGTPLRASGKVTIDVNGNKINQQDLQAYIVVADGRAYVALSKISLMGITLQLLYPITTTLNWLFAIPTGTGLNGFQITGGVLNHSAEITYKDTGDRVSVVQRYFGLDVFDHLKMDVQITGKIPPKKPDDKITIYDYQTQFNNIRPGEFRSWSSSLTYKVTSPSPFGGEESERQISLEQTIKFPETCSFEYNATTGTLQTDQRGRYSYYRVKTARNFVSYESNESILRFAATSKVSLMTENEDPCVEGRVKCVANSSCVVEGDSFRCLCNPGFQTTYSSRYAQNGNFDFGCLDVNECNEGKATCHPNAICVNEIGSYQCVCKPGFSGNGYQCSEIESPCGKDFSLCNPPNSYCSNRADYRTCNCNHGYRKKYVDEKLVGFVCEDVDECEQRNVCEADETCVNREGGYVCECKAGPAGSGRSCRQLDVSCAEAHNCSPNGECVFNETSQKYICRCIRGYYGDGYFCKTYGGRRVVDRYCSNNVCVCPPNFVAIDNYCIESDYAPVIPYPNATISCNTVTNMCHPHAQCVYNATTTQYQCICNAGYEGSGLECAEAELSCLKNDICDSHALCRVDERTGKPRCVCNNHYQGDGMRCDYVGTCSSDTDCNQHEECSFNDDLLGYECRCRNGFVKDRDGITCRPIRVCPQCHQFARCVVHNATRDSFCECLPTYQGDGVYTCDKVQPPCNVEYSCSPHGKCEYQQSSGMFECRCKTGYAGNGTYCYDVRTCLDTPGLCHSNARCTVRHGKPPQCECNQGFIGDGFSCAEIPKYEGGFLFVNYGMSTLRVPYEPSVTNPAHTIQLQPNQIATGLTIDCILGRVYWCDYIGRSIKSSSFKGKNVTTLVQGNVSDVEGVTVDWINRALYWTDSGKKVIETINLDGTQRKTAISTNLTNPRGIAVHPYKRKLFWSDWNRAHPKIEWSNTDGTDRSIFQSGVDVQLPNSVTIDWLTDELCWADAGTKHIMCSSIETRQTRLITDSCISPFGLTVTSDKFYWTERVLGKIGYYDKRTKKAGNLTLPLPTGGTLFGIVNAPSECP